MKITLMVVALATVLAAPAAFAPAAFAPTAFAQEWKQGQGSQSNPPGGSYQGYLNSRDLPQEQTAQTPAERPPHPGTLRKFNSNSGYGPEVQFEVDRREAAKRAEQQKKLEQQR